MIHEITARSLVGVDEIRPFENHAWGVAGAAETGDGDAMDGDIPLSLAQRSALSVTVSGAGDPKNRMFTSKKRRELRREATGTQVVD